MLVLLCLAPAAPANAACRHDLNALVDGWVKVDGNVSERVCRSLLSAARRLPEPWLPLLDRLHVVRMSVVPGPRPRTLADRVARTATLTRYLRGTHTLVIADAAVSGPRWRGGAVSAEDWAPLAARLGHPADPAKAPALLDTLLRAGTARVYGRDPGLEGYLLHGLGRLVYDAPSADRAGSQRRRWWARAVGWEDHDAEPEDRWLAPATTVAFTCALSGSCRESRSRRHTRTGPGAPDPLAGLSPRDDFAETVRLVYGDSAGRGDTGVGPTRRLVLTALLAFEEQALEGPPRPGPSISPAALLAGATDLLERAPPEVAIRTLRPFAPALAEVVGLPSHSSATPPDDLPGAALDRFPPSAFELSVPCGPGGPACAAARVVRPPPMRVLDTWLLALDGVAAGGLDRFDRLVDRAAVGGRNVKRLLDTREAEARALGRVGDRIIALGRVAVARGRSGDRDAAVALLRSLPGAVVGPRERARGLAELATAEIADGRWTPASALLEEGLAAARAIRSDRWRAEALAVLADAFSGAGLHDRALAIFDELADDPASRLSRATGLARIARRRGGEGDTDAGGPLLDRAVEDVLAIERRLPREDALERLAEAVLALRGPDAAAAFLSRCRGPRDVGAVLAGFRAAALGQASDRVEALFADTSVEARAVALSRLAVRADADDFAVLEAIGATDEVDDPARAAAIQIPLARQLARTDRLEEAEALADMIDPHYRWGEDVRAEIARRYLAAGKRRTARKIARQITDRFTRAEVLASIRAAKPKPRRKRKRRRRRR